MVSKSITALGCAWSREPLGMRDTMDQRVVEGMKGLALGNIIPAKRSSSSWPRLPGFRQKLSISYWRMAATMASAWIAVSEREERNA